jgi:LacI family transcriptional regulator
MSKPFTPRATIVEVAHVAKVSRQTVSNAVRNPERVHPDTLARVLRVIDELGYRPSTAASSLRQQRAGALGFEVNVLGADYRSDVTHPFLIELTMAAAARDAHVVPFASEAPRPMMSGYQDMIRRRLVDAFVIADTHPGDPRPQWLAETGIPFVSYGQVWDDPTHTAWADVDGRAGVAKAVDALVAEGYARVGFLGWPLGSAVGDDRRRGWAEATQAHGIADPELDAKAVQDVAEARRNAEQLLGKLRPGDAIVCTSDVLALGVHLALLSRGLRAGLDIGLVGFDDSPTAQMTGTSSVSQPLDRIAVHLVALLTEALAGGPPPTEGVLFAPTLVSRASSRLTTVTSSAPAT